MKKKPILMFDGQQNHVAPNGERYTTRVYSWGIKSLSTGGFLCTSPKYDNLKEARDDLIQALTALGVESPFGELVDESRISWEFRNEKAYDRK